MTSEQMEVLRNLIEWAEECGHYPVVNLVGNYLKYLDAKEKGEDDDIESAK